ncbi:enoyl-CoA delta isomerase 2-like [Ochlerotatus camptorhynchus]|uniref:enoyl-CoA delta isomerase 2-like n=1 Tax=Ochlerotatus camptorhynchus TaxID=644619 RepID=UPI0031CE6B85
MVENELRIPHLLVENIGPVRRITLNNSRKRNAFNLQTYRELAACLSASDRDDSVRMVVLTGAGSCYSVGNDIEDILGSGQTLQSMGRDQAAMVRSFYRFSKLLICVINGPAVGIAAATALLCDVVYMEESAYLETPFTLAGLGSEGCASYTFPKLMGHTKASEMLLLNRRMSAQEALQLGVACRLYAADEFEVKLWPEILQLGALSTIPIKIIKEQMNRSELDHLERANTREVDTLIQMLQSKECLETLKKFVVTKSKM